MNFASTVFPWTLLLRKADGSLADARCDDDGALCVSVVRSASEGVLVEPARAELLASARVLPATAGRALRRLLAYNTGSTARTLQLFDTATAPVQGELPVFLWPVPAQSAVELVLPRTFEAGLAWAASKQAAPYDPDPTAVFWVAVELDPQ